MAVRRIAAENLIELAVETLRADILASLPADKRYTAAMIINALEIARRDVLADDEAAAWSLLDRLYPDGDGSSALLAADIRAGKIGDATHPTLRADLKSVLIAELRVRNPKFLASRDIKS